MPYRVYAKRKSSSHTRRLDFPTRKEARTLQRRLQKAEPRGSPHAYRTVPRAA